MTTVIRVVITAVLTAAALLAGRLLPVNFSSLQIGSIPFSTLEAAVLLFLAIWFLIAPYILRFFDNIRFSLITMRDIRRQIRKRQSSLLNWLLSRPAHWGITGTASEPQYANTCEGLMALRGTGLLEKKRESYRSAMQTLTEAVMPTGLPSRTVNRPTVINTAMLLSLIAMEKQSPTGVIDSFDIYDEIAANLWFLHADDGWGPLILRADKKECRLVNTWYAARALYQYGYLENPESADAFRQFLIGIYEKNRTGTFGYSPSDAGQGPSDTAPQMPPA